MSFLSPFTEGLNQHVCIQTNLSPRAHRSQPGHRRAAEPIGSGVGAAHFLLELLMPRVQKPLPAFRDAHAHVLTTAEGFWRDIKHQNQGEGWAGGGLGTAKVPALPPCRRALPRSTGTRAMPVYEIRTHRFEFSIRCDLPAALLRNERKKGKRKDDLWRD